MKNPARNVTVLYSCPPNDSVLPIPSWFTHVPRKTALLLSPIGLLLAVASCPLLYFSPLPSLLYLSLSMSLSHTCLYTYTHIQKDTRPDTHSGYLDPEAEASGDTKDTTGPRSGPSSHPELILHSQSSGHSLIPPPPPTDSRRPDSRMLGSHAACSKQMPAYKDSHQSSHTEADCAGSPFHSNKGASAEHAVCRLSLHEPQGRLEVRGRESGRALAQ